MAGTSSYPGALDDFSALSPTNLGDDDSTGRNHGERHDDLEAAMEAVQAELGVDPAGSASTVVARLDGVDSTVAGKIAASVVTAANDLIIGTGSGSVTNLAAGSVGYVLTSGSAGLTWANIPVTIGVACSDETTDLVAASAVVTLRMPHAMTVTDVRASVNTAPVGSTIIVDINEAGTSILGTKLSIDATEKTSTTAASAATITDSALADDAEITVDIDQVGSTTAGAGLKVWLIGTRA